MSSDLVNKEIFKALDERKTDHFLLYAHYLDVLAAHRKRIDERARLGVLGYLD